jgi:hypothetical protein
MRCLLLLTALTLTACAPAGDPNMLTPPVPNAGAGIISGNASAAQDPLARTSPPKTDQEATPAATP